jgi:hypothetical protein
VAGGRGADLAMCRICGNPTCGEYSTLSTAAEPVTVAVAALKRIGYEAVGVTADDGVVTGDPTMAHDAMTAREILDKREADKARLARAHAAQHGTAKANENLAIGEDQAEVEEEMAAEDAAEGKAQAKAEDKAAKGPRD